jgi:hypothetical protein
MTAGGRSKPGDFFPLRGVAFGAIFEIFDPLCGVALGAIFEIPSKVSGQASRCCAPTVRGLEGKGGVRRVGMVYG